MSPLEAVPAPDEDVDYVEQEGPGIPEIKEAPAPRPAAELQAAVPVELPRWEQGTIEDLLKSTGSGLHTLIGVAEADWKMTEEDLARIAPPLTRICNRYDPIARVAPLADPILVTKGVVIYSWRSALERQRAIRDAQAGQHPAPGEGYVRAEEQEPPAARASRMRSPAEASAPVSEEELPGTPVDYDQAGLFNNGRIGR